MFKRFSAAKAAAALLLGLGSGFACAQVRAATDVDALAQDVERLTSLREVKDLQRNYAQYEQFGLWNEMAHLFSSNAKWIRA